MGLDKFTGYRGLPTTIGLTCLASAVACASGGQPPQIHGLTDQVAQVGVELRIDLDATNSQGGKLSYQFRAADLTDLEGHAAISIAPSGAGSFRWTPLAADVGSHAFDFTVADAAGASTTTININVKSAVGAAAVFRQPLGTGTTLDLAQQSCVDLDVVVEDQVAARVKLAQETPVIDGAVLTQTDGQTGKWHWCPTTAQKAESRYTLVLSADDGQNAKVIKNYLIVLRGGTPSCPGNGPVIAHTAMDQTTRLDLALVATVTDPLGLKDTPLLYYATTNPGSMPNLAQMTQVSATMSSGTTTNGQWTARVPNPIAAQAAGTTTTLYYVLAADDHDATNNCDHVTQSPVYHMVVTAGGSTTAGLCAPCTADAQCGAGNECVYQGGLGASYCLQGCGGGCPSGYSCSTSAIYSVDNASAQQCVPQSGSCVMPTGACTNDSWDPNQTRTDAAANPVMVPAFYGDLVSCPSPSSTTRAEDDWFKIVVSAKSKVDVYLTGDGAIDLDLHVYDALGNYVDGSVGLTDHEQLHDCLGAATYYLKVNGYGYARDAYSLDYYATVGGC